MYAGKSVDVLNVDAHKALEQELSRAFPLLRQSLCKLNSDEKLKERTLLAIRRRLHDLSKRVGALDVASTANKWLESVQQGGRSFPTYSLVAAANFLVSNATHVERSLKIHQFMSILFYEGTCQTLKEFLAALEAMTPTNHDVHAAINAVKAFLALTPQGQMADLRIKDFKIDKYVSPSLQEIIKNTSRSTNPTVSTGKTYNPTESHTPAALIHPALSVHNYAAPMRVGDKTSHDEHVVPVPLDKTDAGADQDKGLSDTWKATFPWYKSERERVYPLFNKENEYIIHKSWCEDQSRLTLLFLARHSKEPGLPNEAKLGSIEFRRQSGASDVSLLLHDGKRLEMRLPDSKESLENFVSLGVSFMLPATEYLELASTFAESGRPIFTHYFTSSGGKFPVDSLTFTAKSATDLEYDLLKFYASKEASIHKSFDIGCIPFLASVIGSHAQSLRSRNQIDKASDYKDMAVSSVKEALLEDQNFDDASMRKLYIKLKKVQPIVRQQKGETDKNSSSTSDIDEPIKSQSRLIENVLEKRAEDTEDYDMGEEELKMNMKYILHHIRNKRCPICLESFRHRTNDSMGTSVMDHLFNAHLMEIPIFDKFWESDVSVKSKTCKLHGTFNCLETFQRHMYVEHKITVVKAIAMLIRGAAKKAVPCRFPKCRSFWDIRKFSHHLYFKHLKSLIIADLKDHNTPRTCPVPNCGFVDLGNEETLNFHYAFYHKFACNMYKQFCETNNWKIGDLVQATLLSSFTLCRKEDSIPCPKCSKNCQRKWKFLHIDQCVGKNILFNAVVEMVDCGKVNLSAFKESFRCPSSRCNSVRELLQLFEHCLEHHQMHFLSPDVLNRYGGLDWTCLTSDNISVSTEKEFKPLIQLLKAAGSRADSLSGGAVAPSTRDPSAIANTDKSHGASGSGKAPLPTDSPSNYEIIDDSPGFSPMDPVENCNAAAPDGLSCPYACGKFFNFFSENDVTIMMGHILGDHLDDVKLIFVQHVDLVSKTAVKSCPGTSPSRDECYLPYCSSAIKWGKEHSNDIFHHWESDHKEELTSMVLLKKGARKMANELFATMKDRQLEFVKLLQELSNYAWEARSARDKGNDDSEVTIVEFQSNDGVDSAGDSAISKGRSKSPGVVFVSKGYENRPSLFLGELKENNERNRNLITKGWLDASHLRDFFLFCLENLAIEVEETDSTREMLSGLKQKWPRLPTALLEEMWAMSGQVYHFMQDDLVLSLRSKFLDNDVVTKFLTAFPLLVNVLKLCQKNNRRLTTCSSMELFIVCSQAVPEKDQSERETILLLISIMEFLKETNIPSYLIDGSLRELVELNLELPTELEVVSNLSIRLFPDVRLIPSAHFKHRVFLTCLTCFGNVKADKGNGVMFPSLDDALVHCAEYHSRNQPGKMACALCKEPEQISLNVTQDPGSLETFRRFFETHLYRRGHLSKMFPGSTVEHFEESDNEGCSICNLDSASLRSSGHFTSKSHRLSQHIMEFYLEFAQHCGFNPVTGPNRSCYNNLMKLLNRNQKVVKDSWCKQSSKPALKHILQYLMGQEAFYELTARAKGKRARKGAKLICIKCWNEMDCSQEEEIYLTDHRKCLQSRRLKSCICNCALLCLPCGEFLPVLKIKDHIDHRQRPESSSEDEDSYLSASEPGFQSALDEDDHFDYRCLDCHRLFRSPADLQKHTLDAMEVPCRRPPSSASAGDRNEETHPPAGDRQESSNPGARETSHNVNPEDGNAEARDSSSSSLKRKCVDEADGQPREKIILTINKRLLPKYDQGGINDKDDERSGDSQESPAPGDAANQSCPNQVNSRNSKEQDGEASSCGDMDDVSEDYYYFCRTCEVSLGCTGDNCTHIDHPRVPIALDVASHISATGHTNFYPIISDLGQGYKIQDPFVNIQRLPDSYINSDSE